MTRATSGRVFEPELTATASNLEDDAGGAGGPDDAVGPHIVLGAPAVGLWRNAPAPGTLVRPGDSIGRLEILGVSHRVLAPPGARGVVVGIMVAEGQAGPALARQPLGYGQPMLVLDPAASGAADAGERAAGTDAGAATADGLAFRAPTSGRLYLRPAPDRPPFVQVGDELEAGQTVCLLEVMKTFNRVTYGGQGLPARARVKAILPHNEDDLAAGDIIVLLDALA